jgi:hypothetical protein
LYNATANEDIYSQVLVEYREDSHDDLKILNNTLSRWLHEEVYNSKALKAQANVQPNTLLNNQIAQASAVEERIIAIVASGISLPSLF